MRPLYYSLVLAFLAANSGVTARERLPSDRTIQGTVRDAANNEPLPGVNVLLKGTTQGSTTNAAGAFELRIPDNGNSTLVFSFVGYVSQEMEVDNKATLEVSLHIDKKALDEVIVVGYGSQSKRNVTGSISKVDMKRTENLPNTNILQSLRGRVAGVQFTDNGRPGQNGSILIRGPRSLSGGNSPLIVLDGIFFNGNLADINPNDIESMEVLKDASAAAIYGSRAANGVILITSKKGSTDKPTIRINAFAGVSSWSYKPKLLSPDRYIEKILDYRRASGLTHNPADIASYLTPSEAENYQNGRITDPYDLVSQSAGIQSYDLSVSGRTQLTNYFISGTISNEKGLILNDDLKRVSLRANIENKIGKWLTIGTNSIFTTRDYSGREAGSAYVVSPFGRAYYDDGEPTQFLVPEDGIAGNPIRDAVLTSNEEIHNSLFANIYGIVNIPGIEGLSYRINYSPNIRWLHNYNFYRQDKYLATNTTYANKYTRNDFDWVLENILTYDKQIGQNQNIDFTLLYGRNHFGLETTTANASQLSSDALGWNNLGLGTILTNTSEASQSEGISSMLRVNYRLKNRYLLTATVRRDGSSVFAQNNKYATFPSASIAWIASEENFLKDISSLSMLKLRLSYGAVGNQAISPYQSLSLANTTRYVFGDGGLSLIGAFPSTMANTNLKWETTYTTNFAIDFELLKSRIAGTIELYNMDTKDLLIRRSLPTMTGYTSVWANLGATNNKGIELSLTSDNIKGDKFEWSTNFAFSFNKNKIVHLYRSDTDGDGKEDDDLGNRWFIGKPMVVAYDFVMDGIYQEADEIPAGSRPGYVRLKDLNNDGVINAAHDRTIIGQMGQPKFRWGLTNTVRYDRLEMSVFINAMQGFIGTFNELDIQYFTAGSGNYPNRPINRLDAGWWTPENQSNDRPSLVYPNPLLHNYYLSRNFVRLQDISVSYHLQESISNRIGLRNVRFVASGKNIYTNTKWLGTDPENGSSARGFPLPRMITLGINAMF